jgi:hypothetical protein
MIRPQQDRGVSHARSPSVAHDMAKMLILEQYRPYFDATILPRSTLSLRTFLPPRQLPILPFRSHCPLTPLYRSGLSIQACHQPQAVHTPETQPRGHSPEPSTSHFYLLRGALDFGSHKQDSRNQPDLPCQLSDLPGHYPGSDGCRDTYCRPDSGPDPTRVRHVCRQV